MRPIEIGKRKRPDTIDAGPAPMLQWIRIDRLVVDDNYQRELKQGNWKAIERIAKAFKWSRFSPVFVAPVEGGLFAIIDGQHRTHAAAIVGMAEVPCQVVQMTAEEQAASFAAVNGLVTRVTAWQVFKAALAAGEGWATSAASVASDGGCELMTSNVSSWTKKPGQIFGVNSFRRIVDTLPREHIVAALKLLKSAEGYGDAPEIWDMSLLAPMLQALGSPRLKEALELYDIWAVVDEITKETKERIRKGLPYSPKKEALENRLSEWLEAKFGRGVPA
jgi:hypothetical protein